MQSEANAVTNRLEHQAKDCTLLETRTKRLRLNVTPLERAAELAIQYLRRVSV
jgi:hypothetical protein